MSVGIRAQSAQWYRGVEILICNRETQSAGKLQMEKLKSAGDMVEPTLSIKVAEAQTLMDDLWHCGIRPTEGRGSAGALAATEKHLEDMRRLVFDSKPVSTKDHEG